MDLKYDENAARAYEKARAGARMKIARHSRRIGVQRQ